MRHTIAVVISTLLLLGGCGGSAEPSDRAAAAGSPGSDVDPGSGVTGPMLVLKDCAVPGSETPARCGTLSVPEDRSRPDGRHIALNVVVIPAADPDPSLPPLYDFAGGPGLPATDGAGFYLTDGNAYRQHRDIVLVDQRGTGGSAPLHCPELADTGAEFPIEAVRACRQRLAADADLAFYTTADAVADMQAVRDALGHGAVDLFGISYGTRLALAWIAAEPQAIRAATLVGTVPDDARLPLWYARFAQDALDQVFADCRADRACRGVYRDLDARWQALLARPDFNGPARETFRNVLSSTPGQRRIPALVTRMAEHGPPDDPPPRSPLADGLFLSVTCAEDTGWITDDDVAAAVEGTFLGDHRVQRQRAACEAWDVPKRELAYARTPSDVAVLFVGGDRDHVTPIAWMRQVAAAFPRSRVLVIPALGHFPEGLTNPGCLDTITMAFAANPDPAALDTTCVETMRPPLFAAPYRRD